MGEIVTKKPDRDTRFSQLAILNGVIRFICCFCLFGIFPLFVVPKFSNLFEEFGIELPAAAQFVIATSDRMLKLWFIALPILFSACIVAEGFLLSLPRGVNRKILNWIAWIGLILAVGITLASIAVPLITITSGLGG